MKYFEVDKRSDFHSAMYSDACQYSVYAVLGSVCLSIVELMSM